eukprot:TRINITY_DN18754_c0_g1_i1.p1 TRINITY_DN18754_c0_g1~~TRINITY_DN18754_c0_g1_i1.p1  ORF type:complete len:347 (+),score=80.52 TRINITY_DN18754_c0_g1_i1:73-1113(+)
MIRRPPRSTLSSSSAASDVYKRQVSTQSTGSSRQHPCLWLETMQGDQVDALISDFRNARVTNGRSVIELPAEQMDGSQIDLRIQLTSQFPNQPPTIRLCTQGMTHAWLDESQYIINCPSLLQWNPGNSTLRKTMTEIVEEFFLNPPTRTRSTVAAMPPPSFPKPVQPQPTHQYQNPALHAVLAELKELPPSELDKLHGDDTDVGLQKYLQKHPTFLAKQEEKRSLEADLERLARENLAAEQALNQSQGSCEEVYTHYKNLHTSVTEKSTLQQSRLQHTSPEAVEAVLLSLIDVAESQSDEMMEAFQDGKADVGAFVTQYCQKRQEYHNCAIIKERLQARQTTKQRW